MAKRKPTQLSRIESKLDTVLSLLPLQEKEDQKEWVPKVGDVISRDGTLMQSDKHLLGLVFAVHDCGTAQVRLPDGREDVWSHRIPFQYSRPATVEEVAAHLKALEEAKVTELQEEDSCNACIEELNEIAKMLKAAGMPGFVDNWNNKWMTWYGEANPLCPLQAAVKHNPIPYGEFLRRAQGTAKRLRIEALKKELSQLEQGL